jgi:hypothetical protein
MSGIVPPSEKWRRDAQKAKRFLIISLFLNVLLAAWGVKCLV